MEPSPVISCHLMGGLGNQLFQIFTTVAYALRQRRKIVFPYSEILTTGRHRPTYWDSLLSSLRSYTTINPNCGSSTDLLYTFPRFQEPGFQFTEIPSFTDKNLMLYGYFQSNKYFDSEKNTIFSFIRLSKYQKMVRDEYSSLFSCSHTVSMHFRMGDYKFLQDSHPIMPYSYYENALTHIVSVTNHCEKLSVLYFCEKEDNADVDAIVNKLQTSFPTVEFVMVDDSIEDWKQMILMSCCNHHIIANSTFSWWGGYFNQNVDKIVCYPALWFGSKISHNTCDLFPDSWKRVSWMEIDKASHLQI